MCHTYRGRAIRHVVFDSPAQELAISADEGLVQRLIEYNGLINGRGQQELCALPCWDQNLAVCGL